MVSLPLHAFLLANPCKEKQEEEAETNIDDSMINILSVEACTKTVVLPLKLTILESLLLKDE